MGQNVRQTEALHTKLAQKRTLPANESAMAQALEGKEQLLAEILEEEMVYGTHVSF